MQWGLVFIPVPEIGHLLSMVELAKRLISLHNTKNSSLTITILTPTASFATVEPPLSMASPNLHFVNLPPFDSPDLYTVTGEACYSLLGHLLRPLVKHAITNLSLLPPPSTPSSSSSGYRLVGLVFDFFFTALIDVADDLGVSSYIYCPSSAAMLGLMLHLPSTHHQTHTTTETETLVIPSFVDPVPLKVLPSFMTSKDNDGYKYMLKNAQRFAETKGIIINTSPDLEPGILDLVSSEKHPPIYPVGPLLLDLHNESQSRGDDDMKIMKWLDEQPSKSVMFMCFGSRGAFGVGQVHEIAYGLEHCGHRFLWLLRQPPAAKHAAPIDYMDPKDALPRGFLDRTAGRGLVCGWVQQAAILGHESIGGFVSHCGWNSIMESLWNGVPILAWPIYAEQKLNAYRLVEDLGIAVVVKQDDKYMEGINLVDAYTDGGDHRVTRKEVETGVHVVMEEGSEMRRKVEELKNKFRKAMGRGPDGSLTSSSNSVWLGKLTESFSALKNI